MEISSGSVLFRINPIFWYCYFHNYDNTVHCWYMYIFYIYLHKIWKLWRVVERYVPILYNLYIQTDDVNNMIKESLEGVFVILLWVEQ